jgi:O-antigen/teichoic acid export membrane protein
VEADFLSKAGGLWAAQLVNKAAVLGFSFVVGHRLGAEGVGVMASVLALAWVVGTLAGMGMPDRAVFRGAREDISDDHRRLYGLFLASVFTVHLLMFQWAEICAGVVSLEGVRLARGLIVGAGAQCMSSVGLGWLRGAARPRFEIGSSLAAAIILLGGVLMGAPLGLCWAASGCAMLLGSLLGNWRERGIIPKIPGFREPWNMLTSGHGYLLFGVGAWLIGNVDILLARAFFPAEAVGALQVGTMAVRGLGLVPWVAATLMLRTCRLAWASGVRPRTATWSIRAAGVGVLVAALCWIVMPLLARGHSIPVAAVERSAWAAMVWAPVLFTVLLLLPLSAQWHLGRTLRAIGMGLITQLGVGMVASDQLEVAMMVSVAGVGQLVTLIWLVRALASGPQEGIQMNPGAVVPGVSASGGDGA